MKINRQNKILELIRVREIETQEELMALLQAEGFAVTQATVSRDIRELKLTKMASSAGKQKYGVVNPHTFSMMDKFERIFRDAYVSMDMAQNILVIKTVSGMAGAVGAAIDAMHLPEIVGTIAGDDTIMCAIRTVEDTLAIMKKLRKVVEQ